MRVQGGDWGRTSTWFSRLSVVAPSLAFSKSCLNELTIYRRPKMVSATVVIYIWVQLEGTPWWALGA